MLYRSAARLAASLRLAMKFPQSAAPVSYAMPVQGVVARYEAG
jgi:hypothetical protein